MWSNPYSHLSGNYGILEKYTELLDYREQCAVADLHTKVVAALFSYDRLWTKVGWSYKWVPLRTWYKQLEDSPSESPPNGGPQYGPWLLFLIAFNRYTGKIKNTSLPVKFPKVVDLVVILLQCKTAEPCFYLSGNSRLRLCCSVPTAQNQAPTDVTSGWQCSDSGIFSFIHACMRICGGRHALSI